MLVRLEGLHAVKHALRFAPVLVREVRVADPSRARELAERLAPDVADALLAGAVVAAVEHPTGIEADAERPADDIGAVRREHRRAPVVMLDEPRHHGNVGAVVRVAAAAGATGVVTTGSLDPWHAAALRGSAGLHYALPVLRVEPRDMDGPFVLLSAEGDEHGTLPDDAVLVVGSERAGVGAELRARATAVLRLPMRAGVSSLNLATATAAALYSRHHPIERP